MTKSVFYINKKNAVGNGKVKNTDIIQKCIDQCYEAGGGKVILEQGTYVCGTLYMKSNVTLEITASATLLASPDIEDYGRDTHYNRYKNEHDMDLCWIYAEDEENFSITGDGKIDGNAACFPNEESIYRPMMMRFLRCRYLHLSGLKLINAAAWTTAFLDSSYIWIENLYIKNETNYNGDGLDLDGCSHVFIRGCSITGTDDNLCLQAGSKNYPTEHIHISDCEFTSLCAGIRIGLKSVGIIRNVVIANCTMRNVWREGIKIECTEGGEITDVAVQNITMENVSRPFFAILNNRFEPDGLGNSIQLTEIPEVGKMQRIMIQNLIASDNKEMEKAHYRFENDLMGAPWFNGIRIDAAEGHYIEDLVLDNIRYRTVGGVKLRQIPDFYPKIQVQTEITGTLKAGNYYPDWSRTTFMDIRNVKRLWLSGVAFETIRKDEREAYKIEDCTVQKEEVYVFRSDEN